LVYAVLRISFLALLAIPQSARGEKAPHGTVDLIAAQSSVEPARPLWVGLHFQLEKGWHIYWINPGDSGTPPQVKWNLPAGFQASSLHWPIPRRIQDHSLVDYGYQDDVLLPVEISVPPRLTTRAEAELGATVNWVVCRELCLPARATLALKLPVRTGTSLQSPLGYPLIAKARAELPRPAPKSWKSTATLGQHQFVLTVATGKPEKAATYFPFEPNQIENAAPQPARPFSRGVRIELQKSDQLLKPPPRLTGVLVLSSGQGYTVEAPVIISKSKSE